MAASECQRLLGMLNIDVRRRKGAEQMLYLSLLGMLNIDVRRLEALPI